MHITMEGGGIIASIVLSMMAGVWFISGEFNRVHTWQAAQEGRAALRAEQLIDNAKVADALHEIVDAKMLQAVYVNGEFIIVQSGEAGAIKLQKFRDENDEQINPG